MATALLALSLTLCGPIACQTKTAAINMTAQECTIAMFRTIAAFQTQGTHVSRSLRKAECIDQPHGKAFKFAD